MNQATIKQQIDNIVRQIISKYQPEQIILFGSQAAGAYRPDKDVDLLIIKENTSDSGIERRWRLRKLVQKKKLPVDFLVLTKIELEDRLKQGDPFVKSILRDGKVLYLKPV